MSEWVPYLVNGWTHRANSLLGFGQPAKTLFWQRKPFFGKENFFCCSFLFRHVMAIAAGVVKADCLTHSNPRTCCSLHITALNLDSCQLLAGASSSTFLPWLPASAELLPLQSTSASVLFWFLDLLFHFSIFPAGSAKDTLRTPFWILMAFATVVFC